MIHRKTIVIVYLLVIISAAGFCYVHIGKGSAAKNK